MPAWSTSPGAPSVASSKTGNESLAAVTVPNPVSAAAVSAQNGGEPAMKSIVRWTLLAGSVEQRARSPSWRISRALSGPTWLGLQPGPTCVATVAPAASIRMNSVFVPPPSTPILKTGVLKGEGGKQNLKLET